MKETKEQTDKQMDEQTKYDEIYGSKHEIASSSVQFRFKNEMKKTEDLFKTEDPLLTYISQIQSSFFYMPTKPIRLIKLYMYMYCIKKILLEIQLQCGSSRVCIPPNEHKV